MRWTAVLWGVTLLVVLSAVVSAGEVVKAASGPTVVSLDGQDWLLAYGFGKRRTGGEMVRSTPPRGQSPPRFRGSSRMPFRAIMAWRGTGAISRHRPIFLRVAAC